MIATAKNMAVMSLRVSRYKFMACSKPSDCSTSDLNTDRLDCAALWRSSTFVAPNSDRVHWPCAYTDTRVVGQVLATADEAIE
jgi:hypothetical protein